MRRSLAAVAAGTLLVALLGTPASAGTGGTSTARVAPEVEADLAALPAGATTTVVVTLREQADLATVPRGTRAQRLRRVIEARQATATRSQAPIRALLRARAARGKVSRSTPLWVFNGISVTATADVIRELAARADVARIDPDDVPVVPTAGPPEPNQAAVRAPALWNLGDTGQGVVVATLDSGVDVSHPDLASRWRGGSNSWYDPYGQHPTTPTDLSGHGTATTGVIVGGDAGGTSIGTAPGATWIAAKIFNDKGSATATAIHQAFQWVLDPDHDPTTADAPQVVNGSWAIGSAPGCDLSFQPDLQALRAAGILPIFSAGNFGPGGSTGVSPANYPEALAVGAVDNQDVVYAFSSRGPSTCGGRSGAFPDVVAPGVNITTTDRYGLYQVVSGTSLSAPHAAGALALLLSATPGLSADQQRSALTASAVDLGTPGPDSVYGQGRIDVLAARQWVQAQADFTVTATPASAAVAQGGSTGIGIDVGAQYGFTGSVTLTADGLPADVGTATITPAALAGAGTAQLLLDVQAGAPVGTYPITVTASSGAISHAATVTLTVSAGDRVGPATTSLTLTPSLTNGAGTAGVAVHATGDDSATGGSNITAAEYFLDAPGADGSGTAMTVSAAAPVAGEDATIGSAIVNALAGGTHVVSVHSQDAAGNWGPVVSADLVVDRTAPSVVGIGRMDPDPTGAPTVRFLVTFSESVTGVTSSNFALVGGSGTTGAAITSVTGSGPTWTVSAATGSGGGGTLGLNLTSAAGISDAASNALPTTWLPVVGPVYTQPSPALYFSTFGNTNPPGVAGTADDADSYRWDGTTAFSRVTDVTAVTNPLPAAANVDGFDRVGDTQYYLSFTGAVTVPGIAGTVQDEDIVVRNGTAWSLYFDGSVNGIGGTDLDAISVVGAGGPGNVYFSTDNTFVPPGAGGTGDDADIYRWNGGSSYTRVVDASTVGWSTANVDGLVWVDPTHVYLSYSVDTTVPGVGAVQDEDVVRDDAGAWSVYFNGTARGLTAANQDLDAFDLP
jgi:subtilisin family serine protease